MDGVSSQPHDHAKASNHDAAARPHIPHLLPGQPESAKNVDSSTLQCCCGRVDCAYLKHNNVALEDLEKDLETAARLGQALLQRHEAYVSDAESDRARMLSEMERLEHDRMEMQAANARIVEENRSLLEQLEGLNHAVATSDTEVKALTYRLEQTQLELNELAASAARAAQLESQLSAIEAEQLQLQQQLILTQEDEKSAVHRWKKAETILRDLQEQLDQLEYEARTEREQHTQIVERMERRRAVERELDSAAGRLKGAAATSAMDRNRNTAPVVSKFVRDILQDNANLQMGIVELRELLENSNQEVENLREQVLQHQPLNSHDLGSRQNASRLDEELRSKEPRPVSQEFHFHHHYHSPTSSISGAKKDKQPLRRPKKKRPSLVTSGMHTPKSSFHRSHHSSSSTSTIMSQTSASIPPSQRYPIHSSGVTSLASSPVSAYQPSSIFDVVDQSEISRPSSPESLIFTSPKIGTWKNRISDASIRSFSMPAGLQGLASPSMDGEEDFSGQFEDVPVPSITNTANDDMWLHPAIPEEQEDVSVEEQDQTADATTEMHSQNEDAPGPDITEDITEDTFEPMQYHTLRKSSSHESLLSISGMDIHTLRDRPSQLLVAMNSQYFYQRPRRVVSTGTELSSTPPVISTTNITADKISRAPSRKTSHSLLATVAAKNMLLPPTPTGTSTLSSSESSTSTTKPIPITGKASTIGRKVGGWVMGRWGVAPSPSHNLQQQPDADIASLSSESTLTTARSSDVATASDTPSITKLKRSAPPLLMRASGINQKGPIPGFFPAAPPPISIHVNTLDQALLEESLRE
ncbi:hypothetical protein BGW36DRAFT_387512 [Talaromyces proteolyticus]|uniref:Uncharacterized protein n=1 Tax=Talaromyces proteolyticus TaxID=1131652 RepID=A0AAD4KJ76_9EURO|nr:uncharacterized protein BGW36DRAFT_387512 [Talaromyces proteolyticus]KAH8692392.1 hypothetical protein BGW36DRAFT_387512 [Talaromyces proteolyticus]